MISRKLEYKEYAAEEVIYGKGDINKDIYFVIEGEVGAFIIANNSLKEIRSFYSQEGFGDA
jgi:CRP-like cAMP-binding protein